MIFSNVNGILFPVVCLGDREDEIRVNFGASMSIYDIEAHDWSTDKTAVSQKSTDSIPTLKGLEEL